MTWILFTMVLLVVSVGVIVGATPWLMPPTECFTVTVPPSAQYDDRIVGFKRTYLLTDMVITAVCALGLLWVLLTYADGNPTTEQLTILTNAITVATLVPLVASFFLMLHYRSKVKALKEQEGWTAQAHRSVALIDDDAPAPLSLAWNLLYIPLILCMVAFALLNYDRFPEQIPMNADFYGNTQTYATKSVGVVLFPALFTAFMAAVFTITHWVTIVSKRPIDPAAPATSALAYGRFARLQSLLMLIGGLLLSTIVGICFYLSSLQVISLGTVAGIIGVVSIVFVIGIFVVSAITGQSGGRLASELRTTDEVAADNDEHWILGTFYWNPQDPSAFLPKRFGIGWTINFARPAAWVAMGAILAIAAFFSLIMTRVIS